MHVRLSIGALCRKRQAEAQKKKNLNQRPFTRDFSEADRHLLDVARVLSSRCGYQSVPARRTHAQEPC